ncbi:TolC family protein [Bdellovibrionota bacterium FG-1]
MKTFVLLLFLNVSALLFLAETAQANEPALSLEKALSRALGANPELGASIATADAEHSAIRLQYSLENPKIGLMHESGLNFMEQQMGPMNMWSVSQEVKFPAKYFLMGAAQRARARSADSEFDAKKLEIRQKVIAGYYNLFTMDRILALLQAQRETLREVARAAESRHATGAVPQQDEMKAHVEQTKIEMELLVAQEERSTMEGMLGAVLGQNAAEPIQLPAQELLVPKLNVALDQVPALAHSNAKRVQQGEHLVDEAGTRKSVALWGYAPDFMLSYRRAFGNAPDNAYAASIELSIPLWFFAKQTSEVAQASAHQLEAERNLDKTILNLQADIRSFTAKVGSREKLLQIYQTALIPQATSVLNSSRGAYLAGRTSFLELLDSERSLYETRIAFYRNLAQYADNLARLEELAGVSLSNLPFGGSL